MQIRIGVRTTNGHTMMQSAVFAPWQALEHANMIDVSAGERLLLVDAGTGAELTLGQVLKAMVFKSAGDV